MADPDLHMRGVGLGFGSGHPDLEINGGPGLNFFFSAFWASVCSENKEGGARPLCRIHHCKVVGGNL